jgi:hypothetical protein
MTSASRARGPLSEAVIIALGKLVDDSQTDRRDPSHSDLEFQIARAGLAGVDPNKLGQTVGKAKRVRTVLMWALENDPNKGEGFVASLLNTVRGCGGFNPLSPNYVGSDQVASAVAVFKEEGFQLESDGVLIPVALDSLHGQDLTAALKAYVVRAKRGVADAALLVGTGKDLIEATAKHILVVRMSQEPPQMDFPVLLGQAFYALGLATPQEAAVPGEHPRRRLERGLFEAACAVNTLRNREGSGHGRPWLPTVKPYEARMAVEVIGMVSEYLLLALKPPTQ